MDQGRAREYPQHQWDGALAPSDPQAFWQAKLTANDSDPRTLAWYRTLLSLRKQGIAEGWLASRHLHVESDLAHHVFMLRYTATDGREIWVVSRLSDPEQSGADLWQFPHGGNVLVDSRQIERLETASCELTRNHALVVERGPTLGEG